MLGQLSYTIRACSSYHKQNENIKKKQRKFVKLNKSLLFTFYLLFLKDNIYNLCSMAQFRTCDQLKIIMIKLDGRCHLSGDTTCC